MKIVADQHIPFIEQYFRGAGELKLIPGRLMTAHDLQDADMLLVRSVTHVNQALLQHSKVKFVGSVTAGADHLDLAWLRHAGIQVALASGFNAPPVADYVLSVIAALQSLGRLPLSSFRAGVIGVGQVGTCVIEKLSILGHELLVSDPLRAEFEADFRSCSLEEFVDLDLITLHVPLTYGEHATHHFIDDAFLRRQKPGCVLINASRGAVIDELALLRSGSHLQWCFDVWEGEPHLNPNVLSKAVIATPHIAGYSVQSKRRGIAMIYQAASQAGLVQMHHDASLQMPEIRIEADQEIVTWQSVVLRLFNPLHMTDNMRQLSSSQHGARLFDEMRLHFNDRHELAYVTLVGSKLSQFDEGVLRQFGVKFLF